jgi:uncharacterized Ntn-hydrolase superfamily protein
VTYSIVARDPATGDIGAAVQSCHPWVGAGVISARPGVGAVATQADAELAFGPAGLDLLAEGRPAAEVLARLVAGDDGAPARQVTVLDAHGTSAAHTGSVCIAEAGHRTGPGWAVAANMMGRDTVWAAMADAIEASGVAGGSEPDLAHRLLAALDAAEAEGGDLRGQQAAALLIVEGRRTDAGHGVRIDVRVDDHPAPLVELRRLVDLHEAYAAFDRAIERVTELDLDGGLDHVGQALDLFPGLLDARVARLSMLVLLDRTDQARDEAASWSTTLDRAARGRQVERLAELWRRMIATGLIPIDPSVIAQVLPDPTA